MDTLQAELSDIAKNVSKSDLNINILTAKYI